MYIKTVLVLLLFGIGSVISADPIPPAAGSQPSVVAKDDVVVPKQTINGLEKVVKGEVVVLSLSPFDDAKVTSHSQEWRVYDIVVKEDVIKLVEKSVTKFTSEDGSKAIFFGSGIEDKTMFVQVAVTYLYVTKEADKISKVVTKTVILSGELKIGDGVKPPGPIVPDPDVPEGKFGLTKFVHTSINENMKSGKLVASSAVAQVYDGIVTRIRAKTLTDPEKILEETGSLVGKALKDLTYDKPGWSKASTAVQDKLYELYTDGTLKTADNYADALKALSDGLKLVK